MNRITSQSWVANLFKIKKEREIPIMHPVIKVWNIPGIWFRNQAKPI